MLTVPDLIISLYLSVFQSYRNDDTKWSCRHDDQEYQKLKWKWKYYPVVRRKVKGNIETACINRHNEWDSTKLPSHEQGTILFPKRKGI